MAPAQVATPGPATAADSPRFWLVPEGLVRPPAKPLADLVAGARLLGEAKFQEALPLLSAPGLGQTPLASYAAYLAGLAQLNLGHASEARTVFARLREAQVPGFLSEAAVMREAEAAVAQDDQAGAARLYGELAKRRTAAPDAVLLACGRALLAAGDRPRAAEAFGRLYYEFPQSDLATVAATELDGLRDVMPARESAVRFKLEFGRAERLFTLRRYAAARAAFEALEPMASGDDADLAVLRMAECDHYLHRPRDARDELEGYLDRSSRKAEARFFHLTAVRELGDHEEFVRLSRDLVAAFPDSSWAEEALNNLATHYIVTDDDERADEVFREMYARYPQGAHAERAAWKAGWWAYKHGRYAQATGFFEGAATTFPRSDYRPAYLYWSARAREQAGDKSGAATVYRVVTSDYLNSYYGRLASQRLDRVGVRVVAASEGTSARRGDDAVTAPPPPTADLIRLLLSLGLYDLARDELLFAQRTWGDSPVVSATLGWVYGKQGDLLHGTIAMRRAYPQFMAEGSRLPAEVLKVIFPLDYWLLIKRFALARGLDPCLVAALINQESAFDAAARSSANAVGLMQVLPSTGRRYARALRLRGYSTGSLNRPEVNIQLGTAYFAELVRRFGAVHYALMSYNAGESRVAAWTAGRPGLERDEFIDDIPFPETQGYVKKILGSAEYYRRLYADDGAGAPKPAALPKKASGSAGPPPTPPVRRAPRGGRP